MYIIFDATTALFSLPFLIFKILILFIIKRIYLFKNLMYVFRYYNYYILYKTLPRLFSHRLRRVRMAMTTNCRSSSSLNIPLTQPIAQHKELSASKENSSLSCFSNLSMMIILVFSGSSRHRFIISSFNVSYNELFSVLSRNSLCGMPFSSISISTSFGLAMRYVAITRTCCRVFW